MASTPTITILEHSQVAPFPGSQAKLSLPLTFFDITWINFHVIQRLLFYEFPCSNSQFIDTIIPDIKHSLSIALKHFLPLAGNFIHPLNDDKMPEILYMNGDTVSVTFAESDNDFDYLTAKHPRKADHFYPLVPQLPSSIRKSDCKIIPLVAAKVTLFPNVGICIGFVNHHVVGDARTITGFMNTWASIHRLGRGEEHLLAGKFLPFYDRSLVKYPKGLGKMFWNLVKNTKVDQESQQIKNNYQTDKVRATYVITKDQIQMLKDSVLEKWKNLTHVSSFTVTCAYVWTCLVRSRTAIAREAVAGDDGDEFLIFPVDCRERLDPPLPTNYFGNCLQPCIVRMIREKLMGNEGFQQAAYSIRVAINELVNNEGGILAEADKVLSKVKNVREKSVFGIAGSPKFDVYDGDYGWGKPKRYESVSIDLEAQSMSLNKSGECEGGLEVGISLPKISMDAFATLFVDGFKSL